MICTISNVVLPLEAVFFFESVRNSSFAENIVISLTCRKLNKVFSENCPCVEYNYTAKWSILNKYLKWEVQGAKQNG